MRIFVAFSWKNQRGGSEKVDLFSFKCCYLQKKLVYEATGAGAQVACIQYY